MVAVLKGGGGNPDQSVEVVASGANINITTTDGFIVNDDSSSGIEFIESGTGAIQLLSDNTNGITLVAEGGGYIVFNAAHTGEIHIAIFADTKLSFFGKAPAVVQQAITGALSTVADAPAKAVLTSIIHALVAYGLATDGTT